jgi:hypothetical protein
MSNFKVDWSAVDKKWLVAISQQHISRGVAERLIFVGVSSLTDRRDLIKVWSRLKAMECAGLSNALRIDFFDAQGFSVVRSARLVLKDFERRLGLVSNVVDVSDSDFKRTLFKGLRMARKSGSSIVSNSEVLSVFYGAVVEAEKGLK